MDNAKQKQTQKQKKLELSETEKAWVSKIGGPSVEPQEVFVPWPVSKRRKQGEETFDGNLNEGNVVKKS